MAAQRLYRRIVSGKFGLGERGMDLAMANMVQKNNRPPFTALQLGNQMMQALRNIPRDRPLTQRTDLVLFLLHVRALLTITFTPIVAPQHQKATPHGA